jgi:Response regulator containing CheY-like receiver, AAA-type ATPase, and DNA-binding domains
MKNSSLTILLVEDHEDSREAIKSWLEWKGWRVFAAGDLKTGLALGRKHPIDLMICDLQLPDGNGWELMEKMKEIRPLHAVMTSGHCSGADIARSKAVGYIEHLVKPYPVEELDALLGRVQQQISGEAKRR